MKMFSICVAIISLSSGLGRGDVLAQAANAATNAAVIVDPAFGGADHGPTVGNGVSGQAFTLKVARTIVESMAKDGIAARLARQDDSFVPNDEVLLRAGPLQIQPKAYITISVSGTRIGCVRVLYPKPGLRGTVRKNTDVKDAISAAAEDQYWKESQTLANAIKPS